MRASGRIRPCEPSDRPAVLDLYRRVWGEGFAEFMDHCWEWKYDRHPLSEPGRSPGLALEMGGRIEGFLGLMPVRLKIGERLVPATYAVDMMVAPEARGSSGLRLARTYLKQESLPLGGPGPVYQKLWSRIGRRPDPLVTTMHRVRRKFGLEGGALRIAGTLSELPSRLTAGRRPRHRMDDEVRVEASPLVGMDSWLPGALASHANIAHRDQAYLQWRFTDCPYGSHRVYLARNAHGLRGYLVLREDLRTLARVVEVMASREDEDAFVALLQAALRRARELGRQGVETLRPLAGGLARALQRLGFFPSLRKQPVIQIIADNHDPSLEEALFGDQTAWCFTLGDSDFDMRADET